MVQKWNPNFNSAPVVGSDISLSSLTDSKTTDYVGNIIYEAEKIGTNPATSKTRILIDGGYIEGGVYYFYLTDHLGNNRVVAKADGTVIQKNHYYPFGMTFAESTNEKAQPYKYNGKELDCMHGLNWSDYEARWKAEWYLPTADPHAENYYSWSPYVYCLNNPIKYIDPLGMDTVPSNEIWRYDDIINWSSIGTGLHADNYRRVKNKNGELFHLHLITSGENEGNYVAIQQYGKATIEIDGEEVEVDLYDYAFIVGKDRLDDFKAGETKEDGDVVAAKRFALSMGVDGKKTTIENMWNNYKSNWDDPLTILDNVGNAFITFTKPGVRPRAGAVKNTPTKIGNYYRNYTPVRGTKNNPLNRKEIMQRLK